jgi:lipoprotein-anchoring transpeptidase ErfK/SrfK
VESARFSSSVNEKGHQSAVMLKTQVLLDRAHISPGAIDGIAGENTFRARKAYQQPLGLNATAKLDEPTWLALTEDTQPALNSYNIAKADTEGPFPASVPNSLQEMAKLDRLSYTSARELLAEKFHMHPDLLDRLNPGADFSLAGTTITVPNVRGWKPDRELARIEVDKSREAVIAYGRDDKIIAYYPATIGSKGLPSPNGKLKVVGVASNPTYHYSPELNFKGAPDKNLTIASGPNNPVGSIWIDLDKDGYGLHGTPNPTEIGKEASHGCVRLTNWDARELGALISKGTPVMFMGERS